MKAEVHQPHTGNLLPSIFWKKTRVFEEGLMEISSRSFANQILEKKNVFLRENQDVFLNCYSNVYQLYIMKRSGSVSRGLGFRMADL